MELPDMIRELIESRGELWERTNTLLKDHSKAGVFADRAKADEYERLNTEIQAFDDRIDELIDVDKTNKRSESQRSGKYVSQASGRSTAWEHVNTNRGRYRGKSDQDLALRDWLLGKEPVNHIEIDFSGLEHRTDEDASTEVRDLSTGTGSSGLVGADFRRTLYEHMLEANALLRFSTVLNTSHGRDIKVPKSTAGGTATIIGEGTAISEADGGFSSVTLGSWKYARLQQATNELIEDSEVDLTGYLARDMARSVALASGAHFVTGDGSNKPLGLITATLDQVGTAVQGTAATIEADNLIDLFYGVTTPYRDRGFWFMRAATYGAIRKLKDTNGAYLTGPLGSSGTPTLLGRPVIIEPSVAAVGSANASVAFGDPEAYFIRQAPLRLERSDDYAFNTDLVTWRVVHRMDGDLVDATGAVKAADTD